MEHTCIHSSSNQVVCCSNCMDVASEVKVKLEDIKHIGYLILLQFSYISIHCRQMERDILIAMLKWVRVEGEEIAQSSMWKRGKNFSETEKCLPHIYVILQTSRTKLPNQIFAWEQFCQAPWYLRTAWYSASALLLLSPSFWPTHIICTTFRTLAEVLAAPTEVSELNSN